jgi:hypothetical protein
MRKQLTVLLWLQLVQLLLGSLQVVLVLWRLRSLEVRAREAQGRIISKVASFATTRQVSYGFRDAKNNTARLTVIIGGATDALIDLFITGPLLVHLQAVSNATVYPVQDANKLSKRIIGTAANYQNVEDKAVLTFTDQIGGMHRYQIAAPKTAVFKADQETVDAVQADMALLLADFQSNVVGFFDDIGPLLYVGGTRIRRKQHRKVNIFTRDPTLSEPAE